MNRGDYDDAVREADRHPDPEAAARAELDALARLPETFHLTDRQLCERIAAAHYGGGDQEGGEAWASLAARIQRVLAGTFTTFTVADSRLIQAEHLAVLKLRNTTDDALASAKARSRRLSRLGVMVTLALRGHNPSPGGNRHAG
jgi:hypothetical protein